MAQLPEHAATIRHKTRLALVAAVAVLLGATIGAVGAHWAATATNDQTDKRTQRDFLRSHIVDAAVSLAAHANLIVTRHEMGSSVDPALPDRARVRAATRETEALTRLTGAIRQAVTRISMLGSPRLVSAATRLQTVSQLAILTLDASAWCTARHGTRSGCRPLSVASDQVVTLVGESIADLAQATRADLGEPVVLPGTTEAQY